MRATAVSATVRTTAVSVRVASMAVRVMMPIIGGDAAVSGAFAPSIIAKADNRNDREYRECDDNYDDFHIRNNSATAAGNARSAATIADRFSEPSDCPAGRRFAAAPWLGGPQSQKRIIQSLLAVADSNVSWRRPISRSHHLVCSKLDERPNRRQLSGTPPAATR